jgi:O-acetylhomoserine (thiol)-lyase
VCKSFDISTPRFARMDKPSGDFGGRKPSDVAGEDALPIIMKNSQLRNFGGCMSPFHAYLFLLGLETLDMRMRVISENTYAVAKYCSEHPAVDLVFQAEMNPANTLIKRYFPRGTGGLFSFRLADGNKSVARLFQSFEMLPVATNIGDSRTIIQHVETTSHSQLSREQLTAAGIPEGLLRVSMGLESKEDLLAEFEHILNACAVPSRV